MDLKEGFILKSPVLYLETPVPKLPPPKKGKIMKIVVHLESIQILITGTLEEQRIVRAEELREATREGNYVSKLREKADRNQCSKTQQFE